MAEVDGLTLMMAIQAVNAEVRRYEQLLTSETLRDPEEIQSLIFAYEKTAEELRAAYAVEWKEGSNLPKYDDLLRD